METKKSFFLRAMALATAIVLMFAGVLDYTFALTEEEKQAALVLDENSIIDFYVKINGNGKTITAGKQGGIDMSDLSAQLRAEEVESVYLWFNWKQHEFSAAQKLTLTKSKGLIAVGSIKGFKLGEELGYDEEHAATSTDGDLTAKYWIEGGVLYIRLEEGAYNSDRTNHYGGFELEGTLDQTAVDDNNGKLTIGKIDYQFDTSNPAELFVKKSAVGSVYKVGDHYYQDFTVIVGSTKGSATNVYLEEYLGEWFDGIYNVCKNGEQMNPSSYEKKGSEPIKIEIGDTPFNGDSYWNEWEENAYSKVHKITYSARIRDDVIENNKNELANYNQWSGNSAKGKNTVKATSDENKDGVTADAYMDVQTPKVSKVGNLNGNTITWKITIKPTDLFGSDFTLSDVFADGCSEYIDILSETSEYNKYFKAPLKKADIEKYIEENDPHFSYDKDTGTYIIEFTTEVTKDLGELAPDTKIKNTAKVEFKDFDDQEAPYEVNLSPSTPPTPPPADFKGSITKTFEGYAVYEPDIDHYQLKWKIEYQAPDNIGYGDNPQIYLYDTGSHGDILTDSIEVKVDGEDIEFVLDFDNRTKEFGIHIYNPGQYVGKTIYITYMSEVKGENITDLKNNLWDNSSTKTNDNPVAQLPYTTHKYIASTQSSGTDFETEWVVYVQSETGFNPKDVIEITDIIPEGLTLVDGSVVAGYVQNNTFFAPDPEFVLTPKTPVKVTGGKKYAYTFTLPGNWDKTEWYVYVAIKYKTKLADGVYTKIASGELPSTFKNHAYSTVNKTNKTPAAEATLNIDLNAQGQLLNKKSLANTVNIPSYAASADDIPEIPYEITVNSNRETLSVNDNEDIVLVDTLGKRLSLSEKKSVTVTEITKEGNEIDVTAKCWGGYNKTDNTLTFTLKDKTKYVIKYYVVVDFPTLKEKAAGTWRQEDFRNKAELTIVNKTFPYETDASWVKVIQRGFYSSIGSNADPNADYKYVELSITKTWEGTQKFDHKIGFTLTWEQFAYNSDESEGKADIPLIQPTKAQKSDTFTLGDALPAVEIVNNVPVSYFVYTLKEVTVDDKSLEGAYNVSYSAAGTGVSQDSNGVKINCKEIYKAHEFNNSAVVTVGVDVENTYIYTPPAVQPISITVYKVWQDGNSSSERPEKISLKLERKTSTTAYETVFDGEVELSYKDGKYTHTFTNLPKSDGTNDYIYRVTENETKSKSGELYTAVYSNNGIPNEKGEVTITNTLTGTTSIEVTKEWKDGNSFSERPEEISLKLERTINGTTYDTVSNGKVKLIQSDGKYTYTFTNLLKYDTAGNKYTYKVTENETKSKSGELYTAVYTNDGVPDDEGKVTITNTPTGTTSIEVTKVWKDGNSISERPEEISLKLERTIDGTTYETVSNGKVKLIQSDGKYTYTFTNLLKYDSEGNKYTYKVTENETKSKSGELYTAAYTNNGIPNEKGEVTITNILTGTTSIEVTKVWNDGSAATRPEISFTLKRNVVDGREFRTVDEKEYKVDISENGDTYTYKFTGLPKYDNNGKEYTYKVIEENFGNYLVAYSSDSQDPKDGKITVTNTLKTSVKVKKYWKPDGSTLSLPDDLTVYLVINGEVTGQSVTLKDDEVNGWYGEWKNLPKYDKEGKPIVYGVAEADSEGVTHEKDGDKVILGDNAYTVTYDKEEDGTLTITNTLITAPIKLTKTDSAEKPLPGATLIISEVTRNEDNEESLKKIFEWKSTKEKTESSALYLGDGEYELEEIVAPFGYRRASKVRFTVKDGVVDKAFADNNTEYALAEDDNKILVIAVKNSPITFEVSKVDADTGEGLAGASLVLSSNGHALNSWTSTESPEKLNIAELELNEHRPLRGSVDLVNGKKYDYYSFTLTETVAPTDYNMPEVNTFQFVVNEDGSIELAGEKKDSISDIVAISGSRFTLKNEPTTELTDTTEPTDPSEPTDPVPTEPTDDPTVPTESTEATVPTESTDPVPTESTDDPIVPTESTEATVPTEPTVPTETTVPTEPTETTEPTEEPTETTTTPAESTVPTESTEPDDRVDTTTPPDNGVYEDVPDTTPEITKPPAIVTDPSFETYPPTTTVNDNFYLDDDGLPRGNQKLPTDDDRFNLDDDGLPRGDLNMPTGVVVGGSASLAVGSLIVAAAARSGGKRRRSRKNK